MIIELSLPAEKRQNTLDIDKTISFILEHAEADGAHLLLSASRYPEIDMARAVSSIEARKKVVSKIPLWHTYPELVYPTSLSLEQCSSQATAEYKMRFVPEGSTIADITGGLGVDCNFMARRAAKCLYIEREMKFCEAALYNFKVLGLENIIVENGDCSEFLGVVTGANNDLSEINEKFSDATEWLLEMNKDSSKKDAALTNADAERETLFDLIYLDPARRSKSSGRVFSIRECEPDLLHLSEALLKAADRVLVKLSPMVDITAALREVPCVREVHILSTDNECKELLLLMSGSEALPAPEDIPIHAVDLTRRKENRFTFTLNEEKSAQCPIATPKTYLYQPGRAILKAGAFRLPCSRFGVEKIAPSTHLYTSDRRIDDFPGKSFRIKEIIPFKKEGIRSLAHEYPLLNCVALNFPLDTNALKQRLKVSDGGNLHLFATTLASGEKVMIISEPLSSTF